jgi:hypothetical protein
MKNQTIHYLVDYDDEQNVGCILKKVLAMMHLEQNFLYHYPLSHNQILMEIASGSPIHLNPKYCIGKNVVGKFVQELAKAAGVEDWKRK